MGFEFLGGVPELKIGAIGFSGEPRASSQEGEKEVGDEEFPGIFFGISTGIVFCLGEEENFFGIFLEFSSAEIISLSENFFPSGEKEPGWVSRAGLGRPHTGRGGGGDFTSVVGGSTVGGVLGIF